ncbi:protein IMPACT-like [Lingula anatina]|uniref:Protein IMPACT-like n=1 Tax=Lingula anatina TaxID=7574 RepID=A0A1S3H5P5_LINAN|nr:protein IMPACT-like [Lingula anatina]|eukprot:XP_013381455.1 protein IMPACT-like [Lingula anatina]
MDEDNLSRQSDEIEALSSIYGEDWRVVDEAERHYCIEITDGKEKPKWKITLQVTLPSDYPGSSPPTYEINAPWLRGAVRYELQNTLEEVYVENAGESIIYLWVEKIRDYLSSKKDDLELVSSEADACSDDMNVNLKMQDVVDEATGDLHPEPDLDLSDLSEEVKSLEVLPQTFHKPDLVEKIQCPVIHHGDPVKDRKSTFQAHLAAVNSEEEVQLVMEKLLENKKIASATHNILAYRIRKDGPHNVIAQNCKDDGETHAGSRMLHIMQIINALNVMVVVTRWYGGVHLGPDRFKHINNCARTILQQHGYIKEKDEKKGPKSKK